MKSKNLGVVILCVLVWSVSYGQTDTHLFPDGFHIGITSAGNLAQKMKVVPIGTNYVPPSTDPALGWNAGLEFSYHFAEHFGISVGMNYGTVIQTRSYFCDNPTGYMGNPSYFPLHKNGRLAIKGFQIPVNLEFHHVCKNSDFSIFGAVGMNLSDIWESILCKYGYVSGLWINFGGHNDTDPYQETLVGDYEKPKIDLQLKAGAYYRLPYNDLIRLSLLMNVSFEDRLKGNYQYLQVPDAYGDLAYRHNFIGLELAYIHCFKQKVKQKSSTNQTFDLSRLSHSVALNYNNAFAAGGHVKNKSGIAHTYIPMSFTPELSLKYNCTFANCFGLSVEFPLGIFKRKFYMDLKGSLPVDTVWSNGAVGQHNLYGNDATCRDLHYGFSLKVSYLTQIHENMFFQPELGLSFNPLTITKKNMILNSEWISGIYPSREDGQVIPFAYYSTICHTKNNWVPNLSGALNFLVHGKNPCHNFVFGLNFNVDFTKRVTIDYQTVPTFPDKYKSSGQFVFNMTTVGLHVGYQFIMGKKEAKRP